MKRTPLRRTLFRRAADAVRTLIRKAPIKQRRATPRRKAHPANRELRAWVKAQPCCLASWACVGQVDPHHVRTRGAGGGELANLVPLCRYHHDVLHNAGRKTFAEYYGVNLVELAQTYTLRWRIETNQPASAPRETPA